MLTSSVQNLLLSSRQYTPSIKRKYRINSLEEYESKWKESVENPEAFWSKEAKKHMSWAKDFHTVFSQGKSSFEWFLGGELNLSYNCLDRHLERKSEKIALIWEDEKGNSKKFTFSELHKEVCQMASVLKSFYLKPKDVVTIYLSTSPELVISMLACARIGVVHNVVFAGFSPESLGARIKASSSKLVITSDGFYRREKFIPLKATVDEAFQKYSLKSSVLVFDRKAEKISLKTGRDFLVSDFPSMKLEDESLDFFSSEHPLFLMYTSGSTGVPKGLLHTSAGYLLGALLTSYYLFNLTDEDLFWCTADIGWITGHSYIVYGPLSLGTSIFLYEGGLQTPDPGRLWRLIEKYKITKLHTAPTAIRLCRQAGDKWVKKYDLSSLELLGSVGESINQKTWEWYFDVVGGGQCPILDTWWQTETGSTMLSAFPGLAPFKPGCASRPFFGVLPKVVGSSGHPLLNTKGSLILEHPVPSMARTIYQDHARYEKEYWPEGFLNYKTGDAALQDEDGEIWIHGRTDDVINVSGHRLSTMEIESFLSANELIAEASCVSIEDSLTGQALCCFVILRESTCEKNAEGIKSLISNYISSSLGSFAKPKKIFLLKSLPKTRSGKILRRTLRTLAEGKKPEGDLSTLEDATIFESIL